MNHDHYSDDYISGILHDVKSVAILGASANEVRPSFFVLKYLIDKGYRVDAINPGHAGKPIDRAMTWASLADLPEPADMIDIFRASSAVPGITDAILALPWRPKVVWMQLTVRDDDSAARLEAEGIRVVMNRCPKIEYGRLSREIGWSGINSGQISSRKPVLRAGFQSLGIRQR
ncbi:MAG: CoA-binding protein [Notoacmeibacter sp.]|nr:CoA-binding protein [Notoacmeibacter sp.]MCC0031914.1 CoA-binding protein [Brucellaceae bacterium]